MTTTRRTETTETSLTRDLLDAARYYLGGRRGLLILAGLALLTGLALNWSWLVAVGITPILIAVLPCLAMCALGLCMNRGSGTSCSTGTDTRKPATTADDGAPTIRAGTLKTPPDPPAGKLPSSTVAAPLVNPEMNPEPQPFKERSNTDA